MILLPTTLPTSTFCRHPCPVLDIVSTKSILHFTQAHTKGCKIPSRVRPQGFVSRVTPLPPPPRVPFRSTAAQTGLYSLDSALEIDGCPLLDYLTALRPALRELYCCCRLGAATAAKQQQTHTLLYSTCPLPPTALAPPPTRLHECCIAQIAISPSIHLPLPATLESTHTWPSEARLGPAFMRRLLVKLDL